MRVFPLIAAIFFAFLPSSSSAQNNSANAYRVEMQVFRGDQLVASPTIAMQEGATSEFSDSRRGFSLRVTVARSSDGDRLRFAADVRHERNGRFQLVGSPTATLQEGELLHIEIPPSGGSSDRQTYALSVKITPIARVSLLASTASPRRCAGDGEPQNLLHRAAL